MKHCIVRNKAEVTIDGLLEIVADPLYNILLLASRGYWRVERWGVVTSNERRYINITVICPTTELPLVEKFLEAVTQEAFEKDWFLKYC